MTDGKESQVQKPTATRERAFTLIELVVASGVFVMVITCATFVFLNGLQVWYRSVTMNELNGDLEKAIERLCHDLRLSSMSVGGASMAFYPFNSNVYTAISMPIAEDEDGDGLLERDSNGKIIWDKTVIYHVRKADPDQLVRTVFTNKYQSATAADIYSQLSNVVAGATTGAELPGEGYGSKVVFNNLVELNFTPIPTLFDGYSATLGKETAFRFGGIVIGAGDHQVVFASRGKNASSSGYKLGLDMFTMSASLSEREGEAYLSPKNYTHFAYSNNGGSVSADFMPSTTNARWSDDYQLTYAAAANGNTLTLNFWNDLWLDTKFDEPGGWYQENVEIVSGTNAYVTMAKGTNWRASVISGTEAPLPIDGDGNGYVISTYLYGKNLAEGESSYGHLSLHEDEYYAGSMAYTAVRIQFMGPHSSFTNTFGEIQNVTLSNVTKGGGIYLTFTGGYFTARVPAGEMLWSDWTNCEIDVGDTYRVNFTVPADAALDQGSYWPVTEPPTNTYTVSASGSGYESNIYLLNAVEVRHPAKGIFRSGIFDTGTANPSYSNLTWWEIQPYPAGDVDIRVRSGDTQGLVSVSWLPAGTASYFQARGPNSLASLPQGRYVQYEALLQSSSAYGYTGTPHLLDLIIDWRGDTGLSELNADLTTGPDYGMYSVSVDGHDLARSLQVQMMIYKDRFGKTYTASGRRIVMPLNTGK